MSDMDQMLDRLHEKNTAKAAARAARAEAPPKKLSVGHTDTGLYYLFYEGGGKTPEALSGLFSNIDKLRNLATVHGKELAE